MRARLPLALILSLALAACVRTRPAPPPPAIAVPPGVLQPVPGAELYEVQPEASMLRILVYRGGTLAAAGHNHVIATHELHGQIYVHPDPGKSAFQLVLPVSTLEVDVPALREEEGPEFPAEVPETAKQGTRKNMLSEALLDGGHYPEITLTSIAVQGTRAQLQAQVRVQIKGQAHDLNVPIALQYADGSMVASGEFELKQTDLGLTPFSVMLGALQVQDQMRVKFRITCRVPASPSTPSPLTH